MEFIKPERLTDLSPERKETLLKRSMEDISDIYEETRAIVNDVKKGGDQVILKHYQKYKSDIRLKDLLVQPEEIKAAYKQVEKPVQQALKQAAKNIEKFHRAQLEREMWSIEVQTGNLGREGPEGHGNHRGLCARR